MRVPPQLRTSDTPTRRIISMTPTTSSPRLPRTTCLRSMLCQAAGLRGGSSGRPDPLDEQTFLVTVLNALQKSHDWSSTAVVISWDDSDGWYDHVMPPILNQSASSADALTGTGQCGTGDAALPGVNPALAHAQGRCGFGPRLPFMVISPYSRPNFVDHTLTAQVSAIRFIEDNWLGGTRLGNGSFDAMLQLDRLDAGLRSSETESPANSGSVHRRVKVQRRTEVLRPASQYVNGHALFTGACPHIMR